MILPCVFPEGSVRQRPDPAASTAGQAGNWVQWGTLAGLTPVGPRRGHCPKPLLSSPDTQGETSLFNYLCHGTADADGGNLPWGELARMAACGQRGPRGPKVGTFSFPDDAPATGQEKG